MQEQVMTLPETNEAMNLLVKNWNETVPTPVRDYRGYITGYKYGSKNLTKLLEFKEQNILTNAIIQLFYNAPLSREPFEEYEDYKMRRKFTQQLIKFRHRVYNYHEHDDAKRVAEANAIMEKVINQTK